MQIRENETRQNLINDINIFLLEAIEIYNAEKIVKRSEYLNLEKRICNLNDYNFESEEKYKYFLKFINQPKLQDRRKQLENYFEKNPLKKGHFNPNDPFSEVDDYLRRLVSWLK